jgi:hypothetical protein
MTFVLPGFLAALAALAIPIIIHLVFRQRARRVDLGTLRFLRVVLEQNARRRHVMRWLLLALRVACVALLAFLFARPYWLAMIGAGEKQTVAILIDRSATMEQKQDGVRLVDRAVASARELLGDATQNTRFEIAFFDHAVRPLGQAAAEKDEKRRDLSAQELTSLLVAPELCAGGTDFGVALEWARDVLAKSPAGKKRLHIFTDLQQSGLAWSEVDALPEDVATELHDLGRHAVNNVAVVEARAERTWLRPDEQTTVHATVYNGSPFTAEELPVVLRLAHAGRKIELRERLKIEPGAAESLKFDLPPLAEGAWQGSVRVETEDDLALDNERYLAIVASRPYQVLLVDGRSAASPLLAATYFLEMSLRLAPPGELDAASLFEPRRVTAEEILPALDKFDVVVLADVGDLNQADAGRIARFVEAGGGLLVFGGDNVTSEKTASLETAGLTVGKLGGVWHATDLPLRLHTWDARHPIFSAFSDPQLGDLARLSFSACNQIVPAADAAVLAEFKGKKPAVIERKKGKGSVVWFASSADRMWSDWPRSRLYLPFVYQLLGHQTGLAAGGRVRQAVLEGAVQITEEVPGVVAKEGYSLVVNTSPREAETDRCTSEEFAARFGLKLDGQAEIEKPAAPVQAALGTELIDSEIWPWVALALLAALLLETLVANRTAA